MFGLSCAHIRCRLKRIYVLLNGEHGVKDVDASMLQMLNSICETSMQSNRPITLQAIITKTDTIRSDAPAHIEQLKQGVFEAAPLCLPPIVTAATKGRFFGRDDVRWNMIEACGLGRIASNVTHT